jgi:hypothetical protein
MPAAPRVGRTLKQEDAKNVAEDCSRIVDLKADARTPFVSSRRALETEEFSLLERGVLDHKFYVRGIGLVKEQTVQGGNDVLELVSVKRPQLRAAATSRAASTATLERSSSGERIVNSQSRPARTDAIQSSELARMRSSVPPFVSASSASVAGVRREASGAGGAARGCKRRERPVSSPPESRDCATAASRSGS